MSDEKADRGKMVRAERMRSARERGTHKAEEWDRLKSLFSAGGATLCVRCGKRFLRVDKDHVIPVYQGGSDAIGNLQPMCARCNASKGPEGINYAAMRLTVEALL